MDYHLRRRSNLKRLYSNPSQKHIFCQKRDKYDFLKAALYLAIVFLLVLSFFAVNSAGEKDEEQITFLTVDPLIDASGEESIFKSSIINPEFILKQELPVIYGVDLEEVYLEDNTDADIYFDVMPEDIKLGILEFSSDLPKEFYVSAEGPQILIYHTHTQEAYRQIEGEEYVETGSWRTADHDQSVVAVGEAIKQELEEYGFTIVHDTTNHEPPELSTSYTRSLETMEKYVEDYSMISMFIDVHRDAYGDVEAGKNDYVVVNGDECARVMFVVGTGEGRHTRGSMKNQTMSQTISSRRR